MNHLPILPLYGRFPNLQVSYNGQLFQNSIRRQRWDGAGKKEKLKGTYCMTLKKKTDVTPPSLLHFHRTRKHKIL